MYGFIEPFYEKCGRAIARGHIFNDQPVYLPATHGLKITRVDPQDDTQLEYEVCGRTDEIFNHPPVSSLGMESTEGAVIHKTKKDRPVVVLGGMHASELYAREDRTKHASIALVAPVYKAAQYTETMRCRIRNYELANVFYLPADGSLGFEEGFVRLDHIQSVDQDRLSKHRGIKLVDDALDALTEWLTTLLTAQESEDSLIREYRKEMLNQD